MAKKYYWLKLKNDFFSQPRIKKLRRQEKGDTYVIIYLKLQLLSLKDEGRLFFEGIEDSFAEEIALTLDEDLNDVIFTLDFLMNQGILKEDKEEYILPDTVASIGSETDSARRMRKKRTKDVLPSLCDTDVTKSDTEIEIENRDKDKEDINIERETETEAVKGCFAYGKYENVYLTERQFQTIWETFERPTELIDKVSRYLANAPKQYRNCFALIDKITTEDKWPRKTVKKETEAEEPVPEEELHAVRNDIKAWLDDR